jgi:ABC-type sugar transport system permease subunit
MDPPIGSPTRFEQSLYEAARIDGATDWQQFRHVTLPLLRPALLVALIFRTLDALRVFDLIYALTGGGPGTATEPISLYAFTVLLQNLRFGYGSAIGVIVFVVTFGLALLYVRTVGAGLLEEET